MFAFTAIFMSVFFLLSAIGLLWCDNYRAIISDPNWFIMYSSLIGWWVALIPTIELYEELYNEN